MTSIIRCKQLLGPMWSQINNFSTFTKFIPVIKPALTKLYNLNTGTKLNRNKRDHKFKQQFSQTKTSQKVTHAKFYFNGNSHPWSN